MIFNEKKAYTVGEISSILKSCFENPAFQNVPVYGEVYSIRLGKFSYIDLGDHGEKESSAPLLRCAFSTFYGNDYGLKDVKVGDIILITGSLSYYPHGSSITLWGKSLEILSSQTGKTLLEKKKTLEKLDKLGYLDEKRKRKIPTLCKRVAILTAKDGAAYQDILKTLHDRFPVSTTLYPITVQGEKAASSIVKALMKANEKDYDAIILGRGGGSKTDLSCFDDEKVALAIATSKAPVITCIGHTIDVAIADRVSDKRAITPTEGASCINPTMEEVLQKKKLLEEGILDAYQGVLKNAYLNLDHLCKQLESHSPKNRLYQEKEKIKTLEANFKRFYTHHLSSQKESLESLKKMLIQGMENIQEKERAKIKEINSLLDALDPSSLSKKGYALLYKNGEKVYSSSQLSKEDEVIITYVDGRKKAVIK